MRSIRPRPVGLVAFTNFTGEPDVGRARLVFETLFVGSVHVEVDAHTAATPVIVDAAAGNISLPRR